MKQEMKGTVIEMGKGKRIRNNRKNINGADKVCFVMQYTEESILDRKDLLFAAREGKNIGIAYSDFINMVATGNKAYVSELEMRMMCLGEEVRGLLKELPVSLFPIVNGEYQEEYKDSEDTNLFHRFFAYLYETIYYSVYSARRSHYPSHEAEAFAWDDIANIKERMFKEFLETENCQTAA